MTLIKCRDCGKEISSEAEKCPFCGRPMGKIIRCPNCRSINVRKLFGHGFINDVITQMALGNNVNKTYECNDCNYKW